MWGERNLRGPFGVPKDQREAEKRMQEIVRKDEAEEKEPRSCAYNMKDGWWCSRGLGHDGPCALRPKYPCAAAVPNGWECMREDNHKGKHHLNIPLAGTVAWESVRKLYTQAEVDDLIRTVKVGTLLAAAAELVYIDKPKNMIVRQQDAAAWLMDRAQEEMAK